MAIFFTESSLLNESLFKKSNITGTNGKYYITKYKYGSKNIMIAKSVGESNSEKVSEYLEGIKKIISAAMAKQSAVEVEQFKEIQKSVGNTEDFMKFARTIGSNLQAVIFTKTGNGGTFTMYYNHDEFGANKQVDELLGGKELIFKASPENASYSLKSKK